MLKFKSEAEFEKWCGTLAPGSAAHQALVADRPRVVQVLPRPGSTVRVVTGAAGSGGAGPTPATRARPARPPGFRARTARAAAWFFVTVVGLSAWGLSLCIFGLFVRSFP